MKRLLVLLTLVLAFFSAKAQENKNYWNNKLKIVSFRLPPPPVGYTPKIVDLNGGGKPDAIYSITRDSIPILWLDDDGKADMQIVAEYPPRKADEVWPNGHYMIVLDTDKDNIFNYIDWNTMQIKSWDKTGICDFYMDYSGQSAFLKIHAATYNMQDVRLNWENPFLFYDEDGDGLSEMAIRLVDSPKKVDAFTLSFRGKGFDYRDQVHKFRNPRLAGTDSFFVDPRFRRMTELIYPDHDSAWDLIFNRGKWDQVYFGYDEDDDCHRWERVELYDPRDPFKVGWNKGGIDHNKQSDAAGDRGEWDLDNSGNGQLYMGKFDGRLHLYGAEWGCWRIDQNTDYYQGWDRMWFGLDKNPSRFATVKYTDKDGNGFFDYLEYDLDGDQTFETIVDLKEMGVDDRCELIDVSSFKYKDFINLMDKMADGMWNNAMQACKVAEHFRVNTGWYAKLKQALSIREKYDKGYWLQLYLYKDLEYLFTRNQDVRSLEKLNKAYYTCDWSILL